MINLKEIPDWLAPIADAAQVKRQRASEEQRRGLAEQLERETARHLAESPALLKKLDAAEKAEAKLRESLKQAQDATWKARSDLDSESAAFRNRESRLKSDLSEKADPRIDEAIEQLEQELKAERKRGYSGYREDTGDRTLSGRSVVDVYSNQESVYARLAAMMSASDSLRALKETCVPDVVAAIAAIHATIPARGEPVLTARRALADYGSVFPVEAVRLAGAGA